MKKTNRLFFVILAALLSTHANASTLTYDISFTTSSVEDGSAFGGTTVGDIFSGNFSVNSQELSDTVNDFGDHTIYDPENIAYSFVIGSHDFFYSFDPARDYIADPDFGLGATILEVGGNYLGADFEVTEIISFLFEQAGDADSYGLDIDTDLGTWSAYDDSTGYIASGNVSMTLASAVPEPSVMWLLGIGLAGFVRRNKR